MEVRPDPNRMVTDEIARDAHAHNEREVHSVRLLPTFLVVALMIGLIFAAIALLTPIAPPTTQRSDAPITTPPRPSTNVPSR